MKVLYRLAILLTAAALVIGATVAVFQTDALQSAFSVPGEGGTPAFAQASEETATETVSSPAASGRFQRGRIDGFEGDRGHDEGDSLAGLVEVLKNLMIVTAVTLGAVAVSWVVRRTRPRRRPVAVPIASRQ